MLELVCRDLCTNNEVENRLPTLALLGIANESDASDYGMSVEETPSEGKTAAQKNVQLNRNCKSAARKKAAADKQAKLNHD